MKYHVKIDRAPIPWKIVAAHHVSVNAGLRALNESALPVGDISRPRARRTCMCVTCVRRECACAHSIHSRLVTSYVLRDARRRNKWRHTLLAHTRTYTPASTHAHSRTIDAPCPFTASCVHRACAKLFKLWNFHFFSAPFKSYHAYVIYKYVRYIVGRVYNTTPIILALGQNIVLLKKFIFKSVHFICWK